MKLNHDQLHNFAHSLLDASHSMTPIDPFTEVLDIDTNDAYAIAEDILGHRLEHGHHIVGMKIGVTTEAAMKLFGMNTPAYGFITDDMTIRDHGRVKMSTMIQPRVEAEIGFRFKDRLEGPGVDIDDVLNATEYIFPALEIIDCRFKDWHIRKQDLIADNSAAKYVVVGNSRLSPAEIDLTSEETVVEINGTEVGRGAGAEVMAHPAKAVAWLVNRLAESGYSIAPGQFVIPGSLIAPVATKSGDRVSAIFSNIGLVSVQFTQ